jgi:aminotransferase
MAKRIAVNQSQSILTRVFPKSLISQRVSQISPSGIRRFFDLLSSMEDVISLGVGEPDFVTPWRIREAAIYSLEKGYTMYTSNSGLLELRQRLSGYLQNFCQLEYDPYSELLITCGVSEALDLVLRAILDPGDEVILADPSYVAYPPEVILAGGQPVPVPTTVEGKFKLDASEVVARITPRTKAILIGYPANPTGAIMSREELAELAELAQRYHLLVISDEIYHRLVYDSEPACFATLPQMKGQTILLGGFSKSYAMTGWRIGYAAADAEIIQAMSKIHQYAMLCAPIMSQMAAIEALKEVEDDVQQMLTEYQRRRRVMVNGLNEIGLDCFEPGGAFYAFPSIKITGLSSEEFAERLLLEERVAVVPGNAFGQCGEGYIRCCYAVSLGEIEEALRRMARFVARHRQK